MKILAFGASNSQNSINKKLASFTATLIPNAEVEVLDLSKFELPIFSEDLEKEIGQPKAAIEFFKRISSSDGIIISFAEHNGTYTAAYKNLFDWTSRIDQLVFQNRPVIYLATSPGPGGAGSVLKSAKESAKFFGADLKASVSIPSFYDVFDVKTGCITESNALAELHSAIHPFIKHQTLEHEAS